MTGITEFWESEKGTSIDTVQGSARYVHTEIEDNNGNFNDDYYTRDGYFLVHIGKVHHVYRVSEVSI